VGVLSAFVVEHWVIDAVCAAVGARGTSGPSLEEMLVAALGDGKNPSNLTFAELFQLLESDEVRSTVMRLGALPQVGGKALFAGSSGAVPGAVDARMSGVCWNWKDKGTCRRGSACQFTHTGN